MTDKRSVLITGGSRGIGLACAQMLSENDFHIISLSRSEPACALKNHSHFSIDLEDLDATRSLVKDLINQFDISALICNAGRGDIGSIENFSGEQIQNSITLNLISPLNIVRECLPSFRKQTRSDIVFIGSVNALQGARYGALYSAAKFGLRGLAQSLSYEVASVNCHIGIVQPGMVRTSFFDKLEFEPGPEQAHALEADDVANAVNSMLNSPDNAVISELIVQPRQHVVQKRKR